MNTNLGGAAVKGTMGHVGEQVQDRAGEEVVMLPSVEQPPKAAQSMAVPGLILVDSSSSMAPIMEEVNKSLAAFGQKLRARPMAASTVHLGVVGFATEAYPLLGLERIADPQVQVPTLEAWGTTNYRAAFEEALRFFREELPQLKDDGEVVRQVKRPAVFFVTDGYPNHNDYMDVLGELRTRTWAPTIFGFGFGDADRETIQQIADPGLAYFAMDGARPEDVVDAIMEVILKSMIRLSEMSQDEAAKSQNPGQDGETTPPAEYKPVEPAADPATAVLKRPTDDVEAFD